MSNEKKIAILGATGSIGQNAIEVVNHLDGYRIFGITGHSRIESLVAQSHQIRPDFTVATSVESNAALEDFNWSHTNLLTGRTGLLQLAANPDVDTVVAAIMGRAGLESTWIAVEHGKRVALANKESLVLAGQQICELAAQNGSEIIPVDSEHSAIFQCLQAGQKNEVKKIILTASGGPFLDFNAEQLKCVTVEQALNHPTWDMGQKITIDSATMMNKALEIIEARWLFGLPPEQIGVVIHPQSILHSMVEFCDGSMIAQMGPPDMKLPIQYALTYPERVTGCGPKMDLTQPQNLQLRPADFEQFPALDLGFEVAKNGGTTGAVLNAANESAVDAFLHRKISFTDIVVACREILDNHHFDPNPSLDTLITVDLWAREEINKWITC